MELYISESISNLVSNVRISDYGDNVSDHRPVEMDFSVSLSTVEVPMKKSVPAVLWHKLDSMTLDNFRHTMTRKLDEIDVPFHSILHGDQCCSAEDHIGSIQNHYVSIVSAILYADSSLPRTFSHSKKPFWSNTLDELKQRSIESCNLWKENGSPRDGLLFENKRRSSKIYKAAIRAAKKENEIALNERLHDDLASKNSDDFWKALRSNSKGESSMVTRVDGETTDNGIANAFCNHIKRAYSGSDSPAHESLKASFQVRFDEYYRSHCLESIGP